MNVPAKNISSNVTSWQQTLRMAVFDAIKPDDVKAIVQKIVAQAKDGDPQAVKMVFEYVLGGTQPPALTQNNLVIHNDERPAAPARTPARAGSRAKVLEMANRVANGQAAFHDADGDRDED